MVLSFDDRGLMNMQPLRKAYDGVTYFGNKKSIPVQEDTIAIQENHSASGITPHFLSDNEGDGFSAAIEMKTEIVNDFILPVRRKEDKVQGRLFQIRYVQGCDSYFIKSLKLGSIYRKVTSPLKLKDNSLFNLGMGETILRVNLLEGPNNLKITLSEIGMI